MYEITLFNAADDPEVEFYGSSLVRIVAKVIHWMNANNGTHLGIWPHGSDGLCVYLSEIEEKGYPHLILQWDELHCGWEVRVGHDVHDEFATWAEARDFFMEQVLATALKYKLKDSVTVPMNLSPIAASLIVECAVEYEEKS